MSTIIFIFIFCLGCIIGSFLNVVIYRFNTGKTIVKGRSMCMSCSKSLNWYELIPVISFLFQKGKCTGCATKISNQYPIVEFTTGLVFTLIAYHFLQVLAFSQTTFIFLLSYFSFVFCLLIVIAVYDIRHKIIPDKLVYFYIVLAFISIFINHTGIGSLFIQPDIWAYLAGPICALPFALLWLVSKGKWMGLGDAKLILGIGFLLGLSPALAALMLSFWIGTIISILVILLSNMKMNLRTEIPFAPFLILGTLIVFLSGINVFMLSSFFNF